MKAVARNTLPIPKSDLPLVHIPRPSPIPAMPTEADLEEAERRLELTQRRDRSTQRPGLHRKQDRNNIKRTISKLRAAIEGGHLSEEDMYDAIVNLHLLEKTLKDLPTVHTASELIQRIVDRYLTQS